jgi:hypothetical protein
VRVFFIRRTCKRVLVLGGARARRVVVKSGTDQQRKRLSLLSVIDGIWQMLQKGKGEAFSVTFTTRYS